MGSRKLEEGGGGAADWRNSKNGVEGVTEIDGGNHMQRKKCKNVLQGSE